VIFPKQNYFSTIELEDWFWPQKDSTSLFDKFITLENVASILEANFSNVLDGEDRAAIKKEFVTGSDAELMVVAEIESWRIVRTELNDDCSLNNEIVFGEENLLETVEIEKI
jgi:hypothetical protein